MKLVIAYKTYFICDTCNTEGKNEDLGTYNTYF